MLVRTSLLSEARGVGKANGNDKTEGKPKRNFENTLVVNKASYRGIGNFVGPIIILDYTLRKYFFSCRV